MKKQNATLFLALVAALFVEAFLYLDRFTGGGLLTFLVAIIFPVVFIVLVSTYNKLENKQLKRGFIFVFGGFEALSAYIMWAIVGNLLGIIPAVVVLAGTLAMVSPLEARQSKPATSTERARLTSGASSEAELIKVVARIKTFGAKKLKEVKAKFEKIKAASIERERLAREKAEFEKAEREKALLEKAALEKAELERVEAEKAE